VVYELDHCGSWEFWYIARVCVVDQMYYVEIGVSAALISVALNM
jgi:hypothetical protein